MDETFGVDLQTPDFVKVAEGMGLAAEAVGTVGDVDVEDRWSVSPEDLDSLEEPLEILSDQTVLKELVDAEAAVAAGDVVRGVEAVRALRRPAG